MDELVIKTHDFEVAKNDLKEFSEQTTTDLDLKKVDTSKGVGEWFTEWLKGGGISTKHTVTGAELNELTSQVQKHLIDINTMHIKFIQEFGQVYNALEALDKDYIQAILISIKATEETSKRIEATQEQIKKIVEDQKKTLEVLKKFKQKLDNYAHLEDIDKMWSEYQKWHKDITTLSNSINSATSIGNANTKRIDDLIATLKKINDKIVDFGKYIDQQTAQIASVLAFTCELEKIVHLHEIDEMWESLSNAHSSLINICNDINSIRGVATKQQSTMEILLKFMDTLSGFEHLKDIDEIWNKTESQSDRLDDLTMQIENTIELARINQNHFAEFSKYKEKLCSIVHLSDVDELWNSNEDHSNQLLKLEKQSEEIKKLVRENKDLIDTAIESEVEKNNAAVQMLSKKIKYAYLIAGGSLGLAVIELIVILIKVI